VFTCHVWDITAKSPAETSVRMRSKFLHKLRKWLTNPLSAGHSFAIRYLSVNSPELIFDLVNAKPGTNHSTNPTNPDGNSKR